MRQELLEKLKNLGYEDRPRREVGAGRFLAEMHAHVAVGGDPNPSSKFATPAGYSLGTLLGMVRRGSGNFSLTDEQWCELEALGTRRFIERGAIRLIAEMRAHVTRGGNPNPPASFITPDGYRLGSMLTRARNEDPRLSNDQWKELKQLGTSRAVRGADRLLEEMRQYVKTTGHARVPSKYITPSGYWLAAALDRARAGKMPGLTHNKWVELETFGVRRDVRGAERFMREMRDHVAAGGDPNPKQTDKTMNGYSLGAQLGVHRRNQAVDALNEEQWLELVELGVDRLPPGKGLRGGPTAARRLIAEMTNRVAAGEDPNPTRAARTGGGYGIGAALVQARHGRFKVTEAEWAELEQLGTSRVPIRPRVGPPTTVSEEVERLARRAGLRVTGLVPRDASERKTHYRTEYVNCGHLAGDRTVSTLRLLSPDGKRCPACRLEAAQRAAAAKGCIVTGVQLGVHDARYDVACSACSEPIGARRYSSLVNNEGRWLRRSCGCRPPD